MVDIPDLGTKVNVTVLTHGGQTIHSGTVIPPAADGFLTIKLPNGYNVSSSIENIQTIEILGSASTGNDGKSPSITQSSDLPKVTIIHTGGTIASKVDYATGAVVARFEPEELLASLPELSNIAQIHAVKISNMWSDDVRPQHWNQMIQATQSAFDEGSVGVVITHGTDTMHYSSAALAYAFSGDGGRPGGRIVFTGSQRSSDRGSSDASENLLSAVHWAAHGPEMNGAGDATVIIMHAESDDGNCAVHSGVLARKCHSTKRDAFQSINGQTLGKVKFDGKQFTHTSQINSGDREIKSPKIYDEKIRIAQFIAGPYLHGDLLESAQKADYSAVLIHGTGLGHLPIEDAVGNAPENTNLAKVIESLNIPVIVGNQCINGPIDLNVYSKGRSQQALGILGHGINGSPEGLLVKVHWLLSQQKSLSNALTENLCGENPVNLDF